MSLVVLCGSRVYYRRDRIEQALDGYDRDTTTFLHGDAPGADRLAGAVAEGMGFTVEKMPADWSLGPGAGYARNAKMLDQKPRHVVAFWDGRSKGTLHTISEATKRGIPVLVVPA